MTKYQLNFRVKICADLANVKMNLAIENRAHKAFAAYCAQQAIEKTIKLKAELKGLNLWGHNIRKLIMECDKHGIDINVPAAIRKKADMYTTWEADCRYYPEKVVRRDSIEAAHRVCSEWLDRGDTALPQKRRTR